MNLLQIRIDDTLKKEAANTLDRMGLDLSSAIRLFLRKTVEEQSIPFAIECPRQTTANTIEEPPVPYGITYTTVDDYLRILTPLSPNTKLAIIARLSESMVEPVKKKEYTLNEALKTFSKDWGGDEDAESIAQKLRKTRKNRKKNLDW
ncbi:MAG: type II toxin-antitoxin system RelB/DinJ family antitoxin [Paludibacteraceae bacterium]|nr:type II toxin-antitoxin system RelB/DinJ family antitoxin [Paludibacteraceae bacterium]